MSEFGDLEEDDVLDDFPDLSPEEWARVEELQEKINEVASIEDDWDRKVAAKALVRLMNGDKDG